jgi:hypothetical protein
MERIKYAYRKRVAAYFNTETAQNTHLEHFLSLHIFHLQNTEWDKYVQNFIAQQNKFASATDNTTYPTDSGRFIYIYMYTK